MSDREFTQTSYKKGNLKRRLNVATVALLTATTTSTASGTHTFRLVLKGINADLTVHIAVGAIGNSITDKIESSDVPAGAIYMQLTPVNNFPDAAPMFLRPIFQNPALSGADNNNHPLPMECPFGWEFSTVGDEVYIDITVNATLFLTTELEGSIACEVEVEYTGAWNYPEAPLFALNQVQLTGSPTSFPTFSTTNA